MQMTVWEITGEVEKGWKQGVSAVIKMTCWGEGEAEAYGDVSF